MIKVIIECQFCGIGKETGEIAVIDCEDEEIYIQSKDGGFVCKGCWEKFMSFLHDDSKIVLCGADECEPPPEEPEEPDKNG